MAAADHLGDGQAGRPVSVAIQSQGFIVLAIPLAAWFAISRRFEAAVSVEAGGAGSVE